MSENDLSPQLVCIENWSAENAVFRLKASVSNILVLGEAGGLAEASTAVDFPVSLKNHIPAEYRHSSQLEVNISIDVAAWSEEYDDEGVQAFWATRSNSSLKKKIKCVVRLLLSDGVESFHSDAGAASNDNLLSISEELGSFSEDIHQQESISDATVVADQEVKPASSVNSARSMSFLAEMKDRQISDSLGLRHVEPAAQKPARRRSVLDMPLFSELEKKQKELAEGVSVLQHVHIKTAAEKEEERLAAIATVPKDGFKSVFDELKHFSYIMSQTRVEPTAGPLENEVNMLQSNFDANEHAKELMEKDSRISELNAEIQRILEEHELEIEKANKEKADRLSSVEKANEARLASLAAQYEEKMKNAADEHASRLASLTEGYESRISALTKQQERLGGQELLEQQQVMMEAFTTAKENEVKDAIMYQEIKFGALLRNKEERIEELTQELEALKTEKDEEIERLTHQHGVRVNNLMSQQALLISNLKSQLVSTTKQQNDRVTSLNKQLGDLHQKKLSEAADLRRQYDAKLKEYVARSEELAATLQKQVDELTVALQNAELQKIVNPELQEEIVFNDPPHHLFSPPMPPHHATSSHSLPQAQAHLEPVQTQQPLQPVQLGKVTRSPESSYASRMTGSAARLNVVGEVVPAPAVKKSQLPAYNPVSVNPLITNPSHGPGPQNSFIGAPHYTTSVRKLPPRKPGKSGSSRELLEPPAMSEPAPVIPAPTPNPSGRSVDLVSVSTGPLRFIGIIFS